MRILKGAIPSVGFAALAHSVVGAALSMERITNGLKAATGSSAGAKESFAFVANEADRLGLNLETTASSYAKIAASARGTVLEGEATREIFLGVSEAARALSLSAAQSEGALTAIGQIISKGTVQAEELRGQLGERLPGAFQIAAHAMGKTTQELSKMLELGQVTAEEFLPKFARALREDFGEAAADAAKGAAADIERFKTQLYQTQLVFAESGFLKGVTDGLAGLATSLRDPALIQGLQTLGAVVRFAGENAGAITTATTAYLVFTPAVKVATGALAAFATKARLLPLLLGVLGGPAGWFALAAGGAVWLAGSLREARDETTELTDALQAA